MLYIFVSRHSKKRLLLVHPISFVSKYIDGSTNQFKIFMKEFGHVRMYNLFIDLYFMNVTL